MGKELELAIKIGGKLDGSLSAAVNNAQAQINSISKNTNRVMTAGAVAVGAAGAKLIKDSVQEAMTYEKSMAGVAKVVDDCRDSNGNLTDTYYKMSDGILDLSTQIPMTANDIASIVESAGQANIAQDELLGFAESAAKMGIAFDTTAEQAGDWMAQWRTSMGLTQTEVVNLADQINYLGNTSSEKATKLSEVVSRVGSLGQIAGLSGGEVAALAAAMPGVEAEIAATGIKNMTKAMTMGSAATAKQQGVLQKLGFDATGLAQRMQTDATGAIMDLLGAMKQLPEAEQSAALSQYFGNESVAAIAPLLANLNNLQEQFNKVADASKYAGSMQKEYEAASSTTANKIQLMQNAMSKAKIEIGNELLPILGDAAGKITDKIPQIEKIVVNSLERIIPLAADLVGFLADNSDTIVSAGVSMAEAFAGFKIAGGAIKGTSSFVELIKNISKITSKSGLDKALTGVIGSFTGISTASGTVSGALMGVVGTFAAAVGPATLAAAAIAGVALAVNAIKEKHLNYADGMNEAADGIEKASNALVKYNDIAAEIPELRQIISDENSSVEQVEIAKTRLQEIADILSQEYNLTINADTSSLENAVNMAQQLSRTELIAEGSNLLNIAQDGAEQYKIDTASLPGLEQQQKALNEQKSLYQSLQAEAVQYRTSFENGNSSFEQYMTKMNELYDRAKESGSVDTSILGDTLNEYNTQGFLEQLSNGFLKADESLGKVNDDIIRANNNISEFDNSTQKAGEYFAQALASDVQNNNAYGMDSDIAMIENLGQAMVAAGKNTDEVATKFAAAKAGYTDFSKAISDGKAQEMSQNFLDYKTAIGETAESAVSGAAVIANGFENATQAAAKGNDAVLAVINDMKSLGDIQGIFDGMDNNGVADKLTDMAHAMNLIPANKSITIDANGNFSVIQEAENQIASLQSQGNVDVSVNANGDFSVLNEATGEIQTLQGLGAVSLQVNAEGNVDVLNNAQEVIATIDSKSAQISVDGQAYGLDQIEEAKNAASGLENKNVGVTITGAFNGQEYIATAVDYQSKLQDVNKSQTVTGKFSGESDIATAISYQGQLRNKNVTYTVTYRQNGTPPANNAKGTDNWRGGLTYINDQNIGDPREVIEHNGMRYWYEGENILADVPRGARIYTAAESKAFINGSHKDGLENVPFDGYIAELHKGERVLTADEASEYRGNTLDDMLEFIKGLLDGSYSYSRDTHTNDDSGGRQIVFAPQITVQGNGDKDTMMTTMRMSYKEFKDMMEEYERDTRRKVF